MEVGKGKNLVFQTLIRQNSNGEFNSLLDKLMASADRQMARCSLDELKHQWELRKLRLSNMMTDMIAIEMREKNTEDEWNKDTRRRGPWKRSPAEDKHYDEMKSAIERADSEVKEFERLYKEAQAAAA
jgi:hypothetical protein